MGMQPTTNYDGRVPGAPPLPHLNDAAPGVGGTATPPLGKRAATPAPAANAAPAPRAATPLVGLAPLPTRTSGYVAKTKCNVWPEGLDDCGGAWLQAQVEVSLVYDSPLLTILVYPTLVEVSRCPQEVEPTVLPIGGERKARTVLAALQAVRERGLSFVGRKADDIIIAGCTRYLQMLAEYWEIVIERTNGAKLPTYRTYSATPGAVALEKMRADGGAPLCNDYAKVLIRRVAHGKVVGRDQDALTRYHVGLRLGQAHRERTFGWLTLWSTSEGMAAYETARIVAEKGIVVDPDSTLKVLRLPLTAAREQLAGQVVPLATFLDLYQRMQFSQATSYATPTRPLRAAEVQEQGRRVATGSRAAQAPAPAAPLQVGAGPSLPTATRDWRGLEREQREAGSSTTTSLTAPQRVRIEEQGGRTVDQAAASEPDDWAARLGRLARRVPGLRAAIRWVDK